MTASYVVVLPALDEHRTQRCMRSMRFSHETVIVVDNSVLGLELPWEPGRLCRHPENLGVAGSWNVGARAVLATGADYLVMCSTALEFGALGGLDFIDKLGDSPWGQECVYIGWHLIALSRHVIEQTGLFDENFYPAYFEDTDYLYRMALAGLPSPRENGQRISRQIEVDCGNEGFGLHIPQAPVNFANLGAYYRRKWGGDQGSETLRNPFGDPAHDHKWWPTPERTQK